MIRTLVVGAGLLMAGSTVLAQTDVIAERKGIMRGNGAAVRTGTQMIRGEVPYDPARAKQVFDGIAAGMPRFPTLFPETSKTGDTKAGPRIWTDMEGFRAASAKIVTDAQAASAATTDQASFQANFQRVTANCQSCHEAYRQ